MIKEHYCCDNRDALILMIINLNNYNMQAPCIFINRDGYRDIKYELDKLGFDLTLVQFEENLSLLVTNYNNKKGKCGIITRDTDTALNIYNRTICSNKNTFIYMCNVYMGKINENNISDEIQTKYNKNNFTKSDLKPGMVVQTRDGNYYIIIKLNDTLILSGLKSSINGSIYKNDLTCDSSKIVKCILDIIKVYVIDNISYIDSYLNGDNLKEIWSRSKVINITTEDLKKFKSDDSDIIKLKLNSGEIITIE